MCKSLISKKNQTFSVKVGLGVFNDTSDEPLAIYGGPEDAGRCQGGG